MGRILNLSISVSKQTKRKKRRNTSKLAIASNTFNGKFLPSKAPPDAHAHQIDFTTTDPTLPEYKNLFAAIIDNAFTEFECKELLCLAEASTITDSSAGIPTWERATINIEKASRSWLEKVQWHLI